MRALATTGLFCLATGYSLAHFFVLLYNNWYFANLFWLKTGLLTVAIAAAFFTLLLTSWRPLWVGLGWYWIAVHLLGLLAVRGLSLSNMGFTAVLDLEAAMVWASTVAIAIYGISRGWKAGRAAARQQRLVHSQLELRRRLRRASRKGQGTAVAVACVVCACAILSAPPAHAGDAPAPQDTANGSTGGETGFLPGVDPEPQHVYQDRHAELADQGKRLQQEPALPGVYPTPAHLREREVFFIVIENRQDGLISVIEPLQQHAGQRVETPPADARVLPAGHVLAPVTTVNPKGFTASGWAEPGTVCASAVNAIHLKTGHNYSGGYGVIFSLLPIEFAEFDPKTYKSYFNKSSSLFTDISAGTGIFGGQWAPLVGSAIMLAPGQDIAAATPVADGYVPQDGDVLVLRVERLKYNPEWVEFENRFGGLIWIKEIGMDAYPIGQVLKPVVGIGRFLGTQYSDVGRIRAAHPGVLCISTSPIGTIGGFQIIPRDHAMSQEMTFARIKTQWMVVGPLWALDPSWEGLPPLFTDYFYPAFTPAISDEEGVSADISGAAVFLDRFTVRARYSDAENPEEYILLREADLIDNFALKTMTHLRIYFPRG